MKISKKTIFKKIIITIFVILFVFVFILFCYDELEKLFSKEQTNSNIDDVKKGLEDNEPPSLKVKKLIMEEKQNYSINNFVVECIDNNDEQCNLKYEDNKMLSYNEEGIYKITIIATDKNNNEVIKDTILKIIKLPSEDKKLDEKNIDNSNELLETDGNENNNEQNNTQNQTIPSQSSTTNDTSKETIQKPEVIQKPQTTTTKPQIIQKPQITTTIPTTIARVIVNSTVEQSDTHSYKYGVKITTTTHNHYDIYSDGSKILTNTYTTESYDHSTYSASTWDLKGEAEQLRANNIGALNEVLNYVNKYRSEVGAEPLTLDYNLTVAAEIRSLEMAWSTNFSHTRPNGSSCFSVLDELGISYFTLGENVAYGYTNAVSVSEGWKNSPGHYANMISSDYTKIGIGYAVVNGTYYWTQIFSN